MTDTHLPNCTYVTRPNMVPLRPGTQCPDCGIWAESTGHGMSPLRPHHIEDTGDVCESHHIAQASEMMGDEITPAMIEAGVDKVLELDGSPPSLSYMREMLPNIYRAMTAARESGE